MFFIRLLNYCIKKINYVLTYFLSIRLKIEHLSSDAEGFPQYLLEAESKKMDINDYIEEFLGWEPALPIIQQLIFPNIDCKNVIIGELGPGSGRWARHFINDDRIKEIYLFDRSEWIKNFLDKYFNEYSPYVIGLGMIMVTSPKWHYCKPKQIFRTCKFGRYI